MANFIKVAAGTPDIRPTEISNNVSQILDIISEADDKSVDLLVFPELSITGTGIENVSFIDTFLNAAKTALMEIAIFTKGKRPVTVVGLPIRYAGRTFNCSAAVFDGQILGIVPKSFCINPYFSRGRHLSSESTLNFENTHIPFAPNLMFVNDFISEYSFGIEIATDIMAYSQSSSNYAKNGAYLVVNPFLTDAESFNREDVLLQACALSQRLSLCYLISADKNSSQINSVICEKGRILQDSDVTRTDKLIIRDVDLGSLVAERKARDSFTSSGRKVVKIPFGQKFDIKF